ncbi:MAG: hypothetical protein LBP39_00950, partial [Rickettsiales bacterium]|nr:hypothetical protein [Rickettsiales bacterium]
NPSGWRLGKQGGANGCLHPIGSLPVLRSFPKEFMKHFEDSCRRHDIPLLPPHRPKYNGRVENKKEPMDACIQLAACRSSAVSRRKEVIG